MNDRSLGATRPIGKIRTSYRFRISVFVLASRPNNDIARKDNWWAEPAVY
jgi:hypothetical protein